MKTTKILYWTFTGIIAAGMALSSSMYLTKNPMLTESFQSAGLPLYLVSLLGIAKLLGAIGLIIPQRELLKEWVYAGFTIMFTGAVWVHISTHTPFVAPLIALLLLALSYWFRRKLREKAPVKA